MWKVCIQEPFNNCEKIYPIQQRKVKEMLDMFSKNSNVLRVIVFGSSVSERCHVGSDVDIYVELSHNQKELVSECFDFVYDVWTNFMVDERLLKEIKSKGVIVYERDTAN